MTAASTHPRSTRSLPALGRRDRGRIAGGVCSGLAASLHAEVAVVRFAFVVLAASGGVGVALYGLLWAVLPTRTRWPAPRPVGGGSVAVLAAAAGGVLVLRSAGVWFGDFVALPAIVAGAGAIVAGGRPGAMGPAFPVRVAVGISLLALGGAAAGGVAGDLRAVAGAAFGALVIGSGVVLIGWPWLSRLSADLAAERNERIRSEERAVVAAHLHDSVLQTLALLQKRADDPPVVRAMARRQERELRDWLYRATARPADDPGRGSETITGLVHTAAIEVEDDHDVRVEVVTVGDGNADDRTRTLVAAAQEAMRNAAVHAGAESVDVYLETDAAGHTVFVRDRGHGFDPGSVPEARRGIRDSIIGRVERAGGRAAVRSAPGEGTEVELWVPASRAVR